MADETAPKPKVDTSASTPSATVQKNSDKDKLDTAVNTGPDVDSHGVNAIPAGTYINTETGVKHPIHGDLGVAGGKSEPDGPVLTFGPDGEVPKGDSNGRELVTESNPFDEDREVTGKQ